MIFKLGFPHLCFQKKGGLSGLSRHLICYGAENIFYVITSFEPVYMDDFIQTALSFDFKNSIGSVQMTEVSLRGQRKPQNAYEY